MINFNLCKIVTKKGTIINIYINIYFKYFINLKNKNDYEKIKIKPQKKKEKNYSI